MGIRPSELYGIDDEWAAFCFDRAVITFGDSLKSELESVEGKNKNAIERKREEIISRWLSLPRKFADPAKHIKR